MNIYLGTIKTNSDEGPLQLRRSAKWQLQPLRVYRPYMSVRLRNAINSFNPID